MIRIISALAIAFVVLPNFFTKPEPIVLHEPGQLHIHFIHNGRWWIRDNPFAYAGTYEDGARVAARFIHHAIKEEDWGSDRSLTDFISDFNFPLTGRLLTGSVPEVAKESKLRPFLRGALHIMQLSLSDSHLFYPEIDEEGICEWLNIESFEQGVSP